mgnify:CR=1 FL=1
MKHSQDTNRASPGDGRAGSLSFLSRWAIVCGLMIVCLAFLLPIIWVGATSLKPTDQVLSTDQSILPRVTALDRLRQHAQQVEQTGMPGDADLALQLELMEQETLARRRAISQLELKRSTTENQQQSDELQQQIDQLRSQEHVYSYFSGEYWAGLWGFTKDNYAGVVETSQADFPLYLKNSLIIAILSVIGMVISSAIIAYGFSRVRWRGRNIIFGLVLATMMIPFPVLMAPLYLLFKQIGLIGTFLPLWLPSFFGGAFSIFLLRQFFMGIPRELDEAAMLDGCSHAGVFWRITLPLAKPALAVVALLQFIFCWNDFVGPLIFLNHEHQYTLALGLYMFQSQHGGTPWNLIMAASAMIIIPVLVLFLLFQRSLIEGIATQGVKE